MIVGRIVRWELEEDEALKPNRFQMVSLLLEMDEVDVELDLDSRGSGSRRFFPPWMAAEMEGEEGDLIMLFE